MSKLLLTGLAALFTAVITPATADPAGPAACSAAPAACSTRIAADEARTNGFSELAQARNVCCRRGNRNFVTTRLRCRRAGGRMVAVRYCRTARRVCCVRGRRDYYTTTQQCRRAGGRVAAMRVCQMANQRVCCLRGRRATYASRRDCRVRRGRVVAARMCARRPGPRPGTGQRSCNQQPLARVCGVNQHGVRTTFNNACWARQSNFRIVHRGPCR